MFKTDAEPRSRLQASFIWRDRNGYTQTKCQD
jgi:hypothetical protein